tara:strand:+ start:1018 stop:1197 length:180 start_codon:yes stop_codon:yes gene_type:complete
MEIPEHILTTIVLKLEKIKKEIADDDKQKAILSIDLLLENVNSIEVIKTDGQKGKKPSK